MNIILTGMPASGKSTVSEILGKLLKIEVIDTDALIVDKYGNINQIFEKHGEEYFRDIETDVVREVGSRDNAVISTGGGCVLRPQNVRYLKENGKIVYLKTSVEALIGRAGNGETRPLLKDGAAERIKKLYVERAPVYERAADIIVTTDGIPPEEVAKKIAETIK